ncbi:prevent-host-death protein [Burkholderia sp. Bp9142]|uniref:prevent-host-death protein n=1 Tax=Burkholderia sp. Bp9142 TaxID=2184573 RepID=UPI0028935AD3|nr:prevent-host-death protein [Burkholderia sp. Bp9142]
MKTTAMSALRVDPQLLETAEAELAQHETPSAFVESTLRDSIAHRRLHHEFVARGRRRPTRRGARVNMSTRQTSRPNLGRC